MTIFSISSLFLVILFIKFHKFGDCASFGGTWSEISANDEC